MRNLARLAVILFSLGSPVLAQTPTDFSSDRFRTIDYQANKVVMLSCRAGYATTIVFASDEEIESIAIGDAGAWQATPSKSGNDLFLKPVGSGSTNMTVFTNTRTYVFELSVSENGPYLVRFRYPLSQSSTSETAPTAPLVAHYRLRGARALAPLSMVDDGVHVYIEWPPNLPLPAIYSVGDHGKETLLNGAMRGRDYVIDSINPRLVMRRDKTVAYADRVVFKPQSARR